MKIENTPLPGVLLIRPQIFPDDRGYFFESFRAAEFEKKG
ncbi:MAG: dTDP-4-dehydrorhamnose 3,5-epimerase family protein, partial [Candidatus Neomarinimicrobiota bacterium]